MQAFAHLYQQLDATNSSNRKLALLVAYFRATAPADAAWATYFLCGRRPKQSIPVRKLAAWAAAAADLDDWLFEECYSAVGDLAETISLVLPPATHTSQLTLAEWVEQRLLPLRQQDLAEQQAALHTAWQELDGPARFVWHKLLTGGFRVGVSQQLVTKALAQVADMPAAEIARRLMGEWQPTAAFFQSLLDPNATVSADQPFPFCLAHSLAADTASLGNATDWLAEWKWDGIRAQVVKRGSAATIWSRGEEILTDRFPELHSELAGLPEGLVLDGEIVGRRQGQILPFIELQRRITRKTVGKKILADVPVVLLVFDLLEFAGHDQRECPLFQRRELLEQLAQQQGWLATSPLATASSIEVSPRLPAATWDDLAQLRATSRQHHVEGLMLKRGDSVYEAGRTRDSWWKWKVEPYTIDAVLIYAQRGHGRRASLYTDYTFAVWDDGELKPFAKAYSGLTDQEILEVDRFVRNHTREKFGPVRSVTAELVFELAFESLQRSPRHKSGIAVRFPRIVRWRKDKTADQADTLETIRRLLPPAADV